MSNAAAYALKLKAVSGVPQVTIERIMKTIQSMAVPASAGVNAPELLIYRFPLGRDAGHDELLARATNLKIACAAYQAAAKEYPDDLIVLKHGICVIEKSRE